MRIDFRVSNPIPTTLPQDYKTYKLQKEKEKESNDTPSINSTNNIEKKRTKRTNRSNEQFRQIYMKTGIITQASGSAYVEIENTKVVCSVHGPRASHKTEQFESAKLNCEIKYATFSTPGQRIDYIETSKEKDLAIIVRQSIIGSLRLDKYPKTVIDVYMMVLNDDGGVSVAAITAASLALADAGVEMFDMVAACSSVCKRDDQSTILLDPTLEEEEQLDAGCVLVAKMPSLNEVTQIVQTGELSYNNTVDGIDLCIDGCDKIYSIMKQNLIASLEKQMLKKEQEEKERIIINNE